MGTLDVARIKQYNEELRHYKDKSANVRAQLELNKAELTRLCNELSEELGIAVTPENIEEVYRQCVDKVENNLKAGEEILNRIKAEEQASIPVQTPQVASVPQMGVPQQNTEQTPAGFTSLPQMFGNTMNI